MDGIYNWIMNVPGNFIVTKVVSCEFSSDQSNERVSGILYGGTFLLVGYRRTNYAQITAYSYWCTRAISIATIENGEWIYRFVKVGTNKDLQNQSSLYAENFDGRSYSSTDLAIKACIDSLPLDIGVTNVRTYFRTVQTDSIYQIIAHHYGTNDGKTYASAIAFSYAMTNPKYYRKSDNIWYDAKDL